MLGRVNIEPLIAAQTAPVTPAPAASSTSTALPFSLTDSTDPVVGTEGLIYDPKNGVFGGMGAAPITDDKMLTNPFTGQSVSQDLVLAGYQKIYGSDTASDGRCTATELGRSWRVCLLTSKPGNTGRNPRTADGTEADRFRTVRPLDLIQRCGHGWIELL